jgi:tetratricopeptide (TPR) repeat protein
MRMKWLAILALAGAWPAAAQEPPEAPNFVAMSDAELRQRIAETDFSDTCRTKVPLYAELLRRNPGHAGISALLLNSQAICADEGGRFQEGLNLLKQAERIYPRPIFPSLGLYFANRLKDGAEAFSRLRALADNRQLGDIPIDMFYAAIRTIDASDARPEFDEFSYGFTAANGFAQVAGELQPSFAGAALRHAARTGNLSRVDELLGYDPNPSSMVVYLSERTYEPLWPQIEAFAGDNLGKPSEAYVQRTADLLAEKPEDRDRFSRYAHALHFAGRFQEAIDLARNWRAEHGGLAGIEEGDAWSLNIEAYALDALGRRGEADAVFDELAALPAEEHPWVVNFVINRASRLVGQERWEEGLLATELARSVADKHGSTYAKLIIARDRACALQHLGRNEEIAREVEFLLANFNENGPLATTGLICVGRQAEAERLLANALRETQPRQAVLYDMQDPRFELFYTPSSLPLARDLVLANAPLREEVLKYVRILPDRFVPLSFVRRQRVSSRPQ